MRNTSTTNNNDARAGEQAALLDKVERLLAEGHANSALDLLNRQKSSSAWLRNAIGVCQLRLGNPQSAFEIFRQLAGGGILLRQDAPTVFKTNLATAMLLLNNLAGCMSVLMEIGLEQDVTVQRLRAAIKRWKASLSFLEKVQWFVGSQVDRPVVLDFPPGDLGSPDSSA